MMNVLLDSLLALKFFDYASLFLRGENSSSQKDMCVCSSSSLDTLVKFPFSKSAFEMKLEIVILAQFSK